MAAAALALVPVAGAAEAGGDSKQSSSSGPDPLAETGRELVADISVDGPLPQPSDSTVPGIGSVTELASADAPALDPIEDLQGPDQRSARVRSQTGETVVVRAGDSLWSIASRQLGPDAEVEDTAAYVRRIWRLNSDRVPSGTADELAVGQRLVLPAR